MKVANEMKQCTGPCGQLLPRWKFYTNPNAPDGLHSRCIACDKERGRNFRKQRPNYDRERSANMYRGQFDIELKKQNYECDFPSCHVKENLCADHDHKTGKFRAILCSNHNTLLGHADDDPKVLQEAADYLEKHGDYNV